MAEELSSPRTDAGPLAKDTWRQTERLCRWQSRSEVYFVRDTAGRSPYCVLPRALSSARTLSINLATSRADRAFSFFFSIHFCWR